MTDTITTNRSILEKADLALADILTDNGVLQPATAQEFIRLLIKESKVMGMSKVVGLRAPKQLVNKMVFGSRVLRAGTEGTALPEADRSKPTFTKVEHDAQLFKAEVRVTNEVIEDNIERERLRNTIMTMMAERISLDMEEVVVSGDTASTDPFLAQFDGILELAASNVVHAGTVSLNKGIFRDMLKSMPSQYLRNKGALRFLTSVDAEIDYRDSLSDRMTVGGDRALGAEGESAPVGYSGIPVIDIPMFPENLGGGSNTTDMLLLDPKNIEVGIWRQITVETDKLIREGVLLVVASLRFDALFIEETAVVKADQIKVA